MSTPFFFTFALILRPISFQIDLKSNTRTWGVFLVLKTFYPKNSHKILLPHNKKIDPFVFFLPCCIEFVIPFLKYNCFKLQIIRNISKNSFEPFLLHSLLCFNQWSLNKTSNSNFNQHLLLFVHSNVKQKCI